MQQAEGGVALKALVSRMMGRSGKALPDWKSFSILASWLLTRLWKDDTADLALSWLPSCRACDSCSKLIVLHCHGAFYAFTI